ncbi:predicted protein [Chaetoceros tenuissimus]|uniref:Uncharacterized protein n=1 Tax=Chaetoceros tenuissimus TaxID=426638 RepID=A0AAD3H3L9_9STRA|nr:predicted protein [Chaetoceros tenuissimus]
MMRDTGKPDDVTVIIRKDRGNHISWFGQSIPFLIISKMDSLNKTNQDTREASANEEEISDRSVTEREGAYFDWNYAYIKDEYVPMEKPKYVFSDILSKTTWSVLDLENTDVFRDMADELNTLNYAPIRNIPETNHVLSPIYNPNFELVIDYLKQYNYFDDVLSNIREFDLHKLHQNDAAKQFIIHYITPMIRNWDRYCANVTQLHHSSSVAEVEQGWEDAPEQFIFAIQQQTTDVESKDDELNRFVYIKTERKAVFSTVRKWMHQIDKTCDNQENLVNFLCGQQPDKLLQLFSFTYWYYKTFRKDYHNDHSKGECIPQLLAEDQGIFVCFISEIKDDQFAGHWFAPFHLHKLLPHFRKAHNDDTLGEEHLRFSSFGYQIIFCKTCKFECPLLMPAQGIQSLEVESSKEKHGKGQENVDEISPALTRTFSNDSDFSEEDEQLENLVDYDLLSKNRLPKEEGVYVREYFLEYNSHSVDILNDQGLVQVLEQDRIEAILEHIDFATR